MGREFDVEILGSTWKVLLRKESEEKRFADCSGFTDWTNRTIYVLDRMDDSNLSAPVAYLMKVLRHEIVHAFLFESGLGDDWTHAEYGHEETVVDWIAYQIHKIEMVCCGAEEKMRCILKGDVVA